MNKKVMLLIAILWHYSVSLEVMSWVPPYSVDECYANLNADFGEYSPKNVMTTLGLQFWLPDANTGGIRYEKGITDDTIKKFRTKCSELNIKLLLTIYNYDQSNPGWDWDLALSGFKENKKKFIDALVNECVRHGLDGVDVDLEGMNENGLYDKDRQAYAEFIKELATKLHEKKMILTIDSFHSPCYNAPNMAWWKDWVGYVDVVHSMGYSQLYEKNQKSLPTCPSDPTEKGKKYFKYSYQSAFGLKAGFDSSVVSIGVPSSNSWGGDNVRKHLTDILNLPSPTGICIWDFTIGSSEWRKSSTWELANQIKNLIPTSVKQKASIKKKSINITTTSKNVVVNISNNGKYEFAFYTIMGQKVLNLKKVLNRGKVSIPISQIKSKKAYIITIKYHNEIMLTEKIILQ